MGEHYSKWYNLKGAQRPDEKTAVMMGWVDINDKTNPKWYDVHAEYYFPYICELDKPEDSPCPDYWIDFNGHCYLKMDSRKDYYTAQNICKKKHKNAYIVNIETEEENRFVSRLCGGKTPCWIGLQEDEEYWGQWYWHKSKNEEPQLAS